MVRIKKRPNCFSKRALGPSVPEGTAAYVFTPDSGERFGSDSQYYSLMDLGSLPIGYGLSLRRYVKSLLTTTSLFFVNVKYTTRRCVTSICRLMALSTT